MMMINFIYIVPLKTEAEAKSEVKLGQEGRTENVKKTKDCVN